MLGGTDGHGGGVGEGVALAVCLGAVVRGVGDQRIFQSPGSLLLSQGSGEHAPVADLSNGPQKGHGQGIPPVPEHLVLAETAVGHHQAIGCRFGFQGHEGLGALGVAGVLPNGGGSNIPAHHVELSLCKDGAGINIGGEQGAEAVVLHAVGHDRSEVHAGDLIRQGHVGGDIGVDGHGDGGLEGHRPGGDLVERDLGLGVGGGHSHIAIGLQVVVQVTHVAGVLKEVLPCVDTPRPLVGHVHRAVFVELDGQELVFHGIPGIADGCFHGRGLLFHREHAVADAVGLHLHLHLKAVDVAGLAEAVLGQGIGELLFDEAGLGGYFPAVLVENGDLGGGIRQIQVHVGLDGGHGSVGLQGHHQNSVIPVGIPRVDRGGQVLQCPVPQLLAAGGGLGEAGLHLLVDLVAGAGADGIVGMVLHELLPGIQEQVAVIPAAVQLGQQADRLGDPLQKVLDVMVPLLDIHVGGGGADERAGSGGELAVDLPLVHGKGIPVGADGLDIVLEVGLHHGHLVLDLVCQGDDLAQIRLHGLVVTAVHAQQVIRQSKAGGRGRDPRQPLPQGIGVGGELHGVAVPAREQDPHDLGAVGGAPDELGGGDAVLSDDGIGRAHVIEAAAEYRIVKAKAPNDLRCLGDISEGVGEIARLHRLRPHLTAEPQTVEHIADVGLPGGKVLVLEHVPGAYPNTPGADEGQEPLPHPRADLQVILDDDILAVQVVVGVIGILLHDLNEGIEQLHQAGAVLLKGEVPFSVPVGVGDDVESFFHDALLFRSKYAFIILLDCVQANGQPHGQADEHNRRSDERIGLVVGPSRHGRHNAKRHDRDPDDDGAQADLPPHGQSVLLGNPVSMIGMQGRQVAPHMGYTQADADDPQNERHNTCGHKVSSLSIRFSSLALYHTSPKK